MRKVSYLILILASLAVPLSTLGTQGLAFPQAAKQYLLSGYSDVTIELLGSGQTFSVHLVDPDTLIAASAPHLDGSAADISGVPVPAPSPLSPIAFEPQSPPAGFNLGTCEIHMEVVHMHMTDGTNNLLIGLPYAQTYPDLYFDPNIFIGGAPNANSFGEMEAESSNTACGATGFPARSYFDVFHILQTPLGTFFNKKFSQMRLQPLNGVLAVELPPYGYTYTLVNGPIELYDINDPHGPPVAEVIAAAHGVHNDDTAALAIPTLTQTWLLVLVVLILLLGMALFFKHRGTFSHGS